ncbi:MAG TPA: tripartite tricarboxylate transporter substrate binding protein [Burkholderiales bacterium]|nr:tripartite tricarboxylate transporter substrate binding protein [Burkholderiales bacterium]
MTAVAKMHFLKRAFGSGMALVCGLSSGLAASASGADGYPSKPIRLIVPFSPGGGSDAIARLAAPKLTEALGQQVIVDNRPGGNTVIGVRLVGTAKPDGHTLLLANANFTINAALYEKLPYDPIKDFVAVAPLANVANVLVVHSAVPAKSVKELIALVKAKPGQLNFASPGAGTSSHMAGVLLQSLAHLDFVMVPYKGAGPAMTDLIGGQVTMAVAAMSSVAPHLKSGRLRALGVTTDRRSVLMPELPTIAESGIPGYEVSNWFGILAATGTPRAILSRLEAEVSKLVKDADFQKTMTAQGTEPFVLTRSEFERFIVNEVSKWTRLGKDFNLRVE